MNLVDVKCPFSNMTNGKEFACNRTCVKVTQGSSGEAWCRYCRKSFNFHIQDDSCKDQLVYPFQEAST